MVQKIKKTMRRIMDEAESLWLVCFGGFKYRGAREYIRLNRAWPCEDRAMRRKVLSLFPLNPRYGRMFSDLLTTRMLLPEYAEKLPVIYALKLRGKGEFCCPGDMAESKRNTEDVLALLRREGCLMERGSGDNAPVHILSCDSGDYRLDGRSVPESELAAWLEKLPEESILCESVSDDLPDEAPMTHILVLNTAEGPHIAGAAVFNHRKNGRLSLHGEQRETVEPEPAAAEMALEMASLFPELEYMAFCVVETEAGFRLFAVDTGYDLAFWSKLPDEIGAFLAERSGRKPENGKKRLRKYLVSWWAQKHGYVDYMYRNWREGLREDRSFAGTGRREKRWAHKRGFYSWRIAQYGLTEENFRAILSDRDYKWLRPINNGYYKWFWNKKISAYILKPFREYIPEIWFWTAERDGQWVMYPFRKAGRAQMQELLALLRTKGELALKPAESSHGIGFRHLQFVDGRYVINGTAMEEDAFCREIVACGGDMLIMEYVRGHEMLRNIYPDVVNTVRIMTIRRPEGACIRHAYLRIGTKATGHTDNLASGGIAAEIRLEDGKIGEARLLRNHVYSPCERHPDTGALLAGTIPHWEMIQVRIEEICRYLYPLEYLGFDVAVTDDGFRILEINTHQDLQQYPLYPDDVKAFFDEKLAERRKRFSRGTRR